MPVRIIKHEVIPDCGSYEVKFPGGREFFYFEDDPGRRLRPEVMTREQALEAAKEFARKKRDGLSRG